MLKKEVKKAAKEAEKKEQERRMAIADFNVNQMGKLWIDPDKIPTDEDIENAKKDYEEFTKSLQEKNSYIIADEHNALRVAKFMQTVIDRMPWKGREFVGVLNFHALVEDFVKNFDENNPVPFVLDYGAMQFAAMMFKNFGGVGSESAEWFGENWEEFLPIHDKLYEHTNWCDLQYKKSENLKQRWAAMAQGYYMVILEGNDEDVVNPETIPTDTVPADASTNVEEKAE